MFEKISFDFVELLKVLKSPSATKLLFLLYLLEYTRW